MTGAFRPVDPAVMRRAAVEAERTAFKSALDAALRTLAAAALSAALSLGAWQAWRWATASPAFALQEVRFNGLAHASESELLKRSGLSIGDNIFKADLPRAARQIESHPWVADARIERRLPAALFIEVREHRPAALVQLGAMYVLDEEGKVFKRATPEDGLDVPVLTGISRELWQSRRSEMQLRLLAALHLLDVWRGVGLAVAQLSEVRLDEDGAFTLFAHDGDGLQEIRMGSGELSLKLRRLLQMRAALARRGERALRIDLDNPARPDQAAATLADKR